MLHEFERLMDANTVSCVDQLALPVRSEPPVRVPDAGHSGSPGRWLMNDEKLKGRLWLPSPRYAVRQCARIARTDPPANRLRH